MSLTDKDKIRIEQDANNLIYRAGKSTDVGLSMQEYGFHCYKIGAESEALYQQKIAFRFAEWIAENEYHKIEFKGEDECCWMKGFSAETLTTEQLYFEFLNTYNQK